MPGAFVCIVGPSGVGKDTVIRKAQGKLASDPGFLFVRRLVTRPSGPHEDHLTLSDAEFQSGLANNSFALAWRAHGLGYAVPLSVREKVEGGTVAVCNISRGSVADARNAFPTLATIAITAPPYMLTARLVARGREILPEIQARIERETVLAKVLPDFTIANDGTPEDGGDRLVRILRGLREVLAGQGNIGTKPSSLKGQRTAT